MTSSYMPSMRMFTGIFGIKSTPKAAIKNVMHTFAPPKIPGLLVSIALTSNFAADRNADSSSESALGLIWNRPRGYGQIWTIAHLPKKDRNSGLDIGLG
jgi:hypothetical protein